MTTNIANVKHIGVSVAREAGMSYLQLFRAEHHRRISYIAARKASCGFLGNFHVGNEKIDRRHAEDRHDFHKWTHDGKDMPCLHEDLNILSRDRSSLT